MKCGLLFLLLAAAFTGIARAEEAPSTEPLLRLLNSRSSGGDRSYVIAAREVAAQARAGGVLQRFAYALLSEEEAMPADLRLNPQDRETFLVEARPLVRREALDAHNGLAWYLLYLDSHDEALLDKAVAADCVQALNAAGTRRLTAAAGIENRALREATMRKCFEYFARAAELGDANGHNNLGICRQGGYGCEQDELAALDSFSAAAKLGHPEAINNLGRFYREGIVVQRDLNRAFRCFRLSAKAGNVWGRINYALALMRGEGVKAEVGMALELLQELARAGRIEAMECLARCYGEGVGELKADSWRSLVWTVRARAARGDARAQKWLEENHEDTDDR